MINPHTIKKHANIFYLTLALLLVALPVAFYLHRPQKKTETTADLKLLKDYTFVSDTDSLKNSLAGLDASSLKYLDALIQLKWNLIAQQNGYNASYFKEIDSLTAKYKSQSRKNIASLLKVRVFIAKNKGHVASDLLFLIPHFEANRDTSALAMSYLLLYDTQKSMAHNQNYGTKKLIDLYYSKFVELSSHSSQPYDKASYYSLYISVNRDLRDKKTEGEVLGNYTKLMGIINTHKELEFMRQPSLMLMVAHYGIRGQYDVSNQFALQALKAPIKNYEQALLHCVSINYYYSMRYDSALIYIDKALQGNSEDSESLHHMYSHKLGILSYMKGTPQSVIFNTYFKNDSISKVLNEVRRNSYVFDLQEKYHAEEKEKEIATQEKEKKILLFVSALVMLALILVVVLLWINRQVRKKLQQEISTREDILSVISHDLLSPLLALENTILQTQKLPAGDNETRQQNLKKQQLYVQNMKSLSENLINWLWHDKSKSATSVSIEHCINDVRNGLDVFFEMHKCSVVTCTELSRPYPTTPYGNALKVVLRNVLTNTVRHSNATNMLIEYTVGMNTISISIYDNGEQQDDAFQTDLSNFINGQSPETHFSGLGLYLTQKFIRQLKGRYAIQNSDRPDYQTLQIITF